MLRTLTLGTLGVLALGATASAQQGEVTWIESENVTAAFAKGSPLLENESYKVHASRREAAGQAEVHVLDTDIIYVLEGSATFVTGGTVADGKTVAPQEIRGASIANGETRELSKGDVVVVPNGTPHWFKEIRGPVLYYVVKVTDRGASR
jgi:glc operon protein GlcG